MANTNMAPKTWRIVQLDRATLPVALPTFSFAHTLECFDNTHPDQVMARIAKADIVITNKVALGREVIEATPSLRMIGVQAIGLDHLDTDALAARQIDVFNAAGYANDGVAEHALMMMLVLRRRLVEYTQAVHTGQWSRSPLFCHLGSAFDDLHSQTLGLVGYGGIAQSLERMATGLGMTVLRAERPHATTIRAGYTAFAQVLRQAQVVSLHCPLTRETRHLINADTLALMSPQSILINTGRGGLIDEKALLQALKQGHLAAGLDVLSIEPPPADHPMLQYRGDNLLITPHSAWLGQASLHRLVNLLADKITAAVGLLPQKIPAEC